MDKQELTLELKDAARGLGFQLTGVCAATEPPGLDRFREWIRRGYAAGMRFLTDRTAAYEHPNSILDGVRSLVMLGMSYRTEEPLEPGSGEGRVSRYAWGRVDYHDLIHAKLKQLAVRARELCPTAKFRGVVDTAPLLERDFARLAGLGWIGKNTLLLNRELGSWFFLAALLTDQELECDAPFETDHCGSCRACLDACPTHAFVEPLVLDASRCISYLTIEHRGPLNEGRQPDLANWVFGCDVCQEVCPWNRRAAASGEPLFAPDRSLVPLDLVRLLSCDEPHFREMFRHTPLWRAKRHGLLRNAAIVLGNQRHAAAIEALETGLKDSEPSVQEACAWALGRMDDPRANEILRQARSNQASARATSSGSQPSEP
jgi:epoxyqueuosine reductase